MAHIIDSAAAEKIQGWKVGEKALSDAQYHQEMTVGRLSKNIGGSNRNGTNPEWALGQGMTHDDLVRRLNKIRPGFQTIVLPKKTDKVAFMFDHGDKLVFLTVGERGFAPERSIYDTQDELVEDFSVGTAKNPIQRADVMKQAHWVTDESIPYFKGKWEFEDPTQGLGAKKQTRINNEVKRGWRRVLADILHHGYLSIEEIEREFGADDTYQWQEGTGKAPRVSLY
jgi:hypothetical protein